jgi:hypothetical protein
MADNLPRELVCNVKQANALFPSKFLHETLSGMPGGVHMVLTAIHPKSKQKLVAVGYKYNRKNTSLFIATDGAGSTTPGTPYEMKYHNECGNQCVRYVDRPDLVAFYYQHNNANDVINQLRQGFLRVEKKWITKSPYFRMENFSSRYLLC